MKLGFFKAPGILDHIKKEEGGEEREKSLREGDSDLFPSKCKLPVKS